jgi:hypothetical protein
MRGCNQFVTVEWTRRSDASRYALVGEDLGNRARHW